MNPPKPPLTKLKKPITLCTAISFVFSLAACALSPAPERTNISVSPEGIVTTAPSSTVKPIAPTNTDKPVPPESTPKSAAAETAVMIGSWEISYATGKDDEDYSLQNIYGTGISYGGVLTLNQDGTFSKYIGITTNDPDSYEGIYTVSGNSIRLTYRNNRIENAAYLPDSDEIKLQNEDFSDNSVIYEYFVRSQNNG